MHSWNAYGPTIRVEHFLLNPAPGAKPNAASSICPRCDHGSLLGTRELSSGRLCEFDNCMHCGQHYRYTDIEDMRRRDGIT